MAIVVVKNMLCVKSVYSRLSVLLLARYQLGMARCGSCYAGLMPGRVIMYLFFVKWQFFWTNSLWFFNSLFIII